MKYTGRTSRNINIKALGLLLCILVASYGIIKAPASDTRKLEADLRKKQQLINEEKGKKVDGTSTLPSQSTSAFYYSSFGSFAAAPLNCKSYIIISTHLHNVPKHTYLRIFYLSILPTIVQEMRHTAHRYCGQKIRKKELLHIAEAHNDRSYKLTKINQLYKA